MKKSMIAISVMALIGSGAAMAASPNVQGGTSKPAGVAVGSSTHFMFANGNSGVALNGAGSYIDLADGPIKGSNTAIAARGNGGILKATDMGLPLPIDVAQVWKASATQGTSNFVINSVRQITTLSFAPQFGGLVIGQAANASGTPLAVGSGVYFGEWAPRVSGASGTNLNMTSADRTVWYVGDNAVTATPNLASVNYNVIGINQTGTDASGNVLAGGLPTSPNLYRGTLTANYNNGSVTNALTGSLTRTGSATININAAINSTGQFSGNGAEGRFYNNANELAGIYTGGGTAASHVAFGGSRSN